MNQRRLWNDPSVRAARQAAAEAFMGKPMELDPLPTSYPKVLQPTRPLPPRRRKKDKAA